MNRRNSESLKSKRKRHSTSSGKMHISSKYMPSWLSALDKARVQENISSARRAYPYAFIDRVPVPSYISRRSRHIHKAEMIYGKSFDELLKKVPLCSKDLQDEILAKGRGAYYSSGSRPNQTSTSWARARFASAISGGPAAIIDKKIILRHCAKNSLPVQKLRQRLNERSPSKSTFF